MIYSATLRLKIANYFVRHLLHLPRGFSADFYDWATTLDECTATFWCSDDNPNPIERKTKEDLTNMITNRFADNIISDYMQMPKAFKLHKMGTPINNPLFKINPTKKHDDYKQHYDI